MCKKAPDKDFKKLVNKAIKKDIHSGHFVKEKKGNVRYDINLRDDQLHGISKIYYKDGSLKESANFNNGLLSGLLVKNNRDGSKELQCNFLNGKLHGQCTNYGRDENIEDQFTYKQGNLNGPFEMYYSNGRLKEKGNYLGGKLNGFFHSYYSDGTHKLSANFKNNLLNGNYKEYYMMTDQVKRDLTYKNNVLEGPVKNYYRNGRLNFVGNFSEGVLHGFTKKYNDKGTLIENREYRYGKPIYTQAELEMMRLKVARQNALANTFNSINTSMQNAERNRLLRQQNAIQSLNLYQNTLPRTYTGTIGNQRVDIRSSY